jgi:Uncharacterized membrane protein (homolog of Drosophila rhomboid)
MRFERPAEPQATENLILTCCLVFALQTLTGPWFEMLFSLSWAGLRAGWIWQLITYQFLHGNAPHLLLNMIALWFAGRELERVLGTRRFLTLYFAGGVVGGLLQVVLSPYVPLVGASASVCAVLLCLTSLFPNVPLTALIFFILPLRTRAKYLGWGMVIAGIVFWVSGLMPNVGHAAHLGGFVTGWVFALIYRREFRHLAAGNPFARRVSEPWPHTPPPVTEAQFEIVRDETPARTVDEVLAKILRDGIDSLTREERRILEDARRRR